MRLFTHNILQCHVKSCISSGKNYPLIFSTDSAVEIRSAEFSEEFITRTLNRLDLSALMTAISSLGSMNIDDKKIVESYQSSDGVLLPPYPEHLLKALHSILFEHDITEGKLICRNCERSYPIKNGIPNMLLHHDELVDSEDN